MLTKYSLKCALCHTQFYTRPTRHKHEKENNHKTKHVAPPDQSKRLSVLAMTFIKTRFKISCVIREYAFYVCENKGPDQLSGSRTADQCLSFPYIANTNTLLEVHESEISNLKPSTLSVLVLVGDLEHRFSRDMAQI